MNHRRIVKRLLVWFARNARDLPWRRTCDPYGIWVAEVMLQQTQVKTVLPYWERWMRNLPHLESLAQTKPEHLRKLWEGLGYYSRVRNLQSAARVVVREHAGRFPDDLEAMLDLPGIGRYTAGALCSIAFNQPAPILDGNVTRVLARLFGIPGDPRRQPANGQLWGLAQELVQCAQSLEKWAQRESLGGMKPNPRATEAKAFKRCCSQFNQSLMELGALVCTPRHPACQKCPVHGFCVAFREKRTAELPSQTARPPAVPRRFLAFLVQKPGVLLVRQRPAGMVNGHFWELPNVESQPRERDVMAAARQALGFRPASVEFLCRLKHSITKYRMTLEVFRAAPPKRGQRKSFPLRWAGREQLGKLAFTSAHRRILTRYT